MEVKGYKQKGEPQTYSTFDCDAVLDYIEGMRREEVIVVETMYNGEEEIKVYFFVREDGEQLTLGLSETNEDNGEKNNG
jgi:hypothetical protein